MKTLRISKPVFSTQSESSNGFENNPSTAAAKDPEHTMATVLMTRLHDSKLQNKFHRLMVMGEDEKVINTYPLNQKVTMVGRSRRNHVQINDPLISIKHMTISQSNSTCVVNDLDSSNGTFVNGERLSGIRILNDGDEIMIGKTVMRFAARQADPAERAKADRLKLFVKKTFLVPTAAVFCLAVAAAFVYQDIPRGPNRFTARILASTSEAGRSTAQASEKKAARPPSAVAAGSPDGLQHSVRPMQSSHIQQALTDYATGRIENARETLNTLVSAREQSAQAFQARQILSMLDAVQELHARALLAQRQNKFAEAIEYWDGLLALDMDLVGDSPSYLAAQAEQQVQALTYEFALEAFRRKNNEKARQLCQVILQIDPRNKKALALLAKIDSKA